MCGIYGYFDATRRSLPDEVVAAMGEVIVHRGPDDAGLYHSHEDAVAIGARRLSIIDVEHGHQPFVSDDGDIVLVQNGAIFNYPELMAELAAGGVHCRTHCDTEVLLRLYEVHGIDFVDRLNGMFAIAIHDRRRECVYLIRDRVGEKPLHYRYDDGRLVFGSEIKSILEAPGGRRVSDRALFEYLTFNYVPPPRTMFEGVRHVMPGTWVRVNRNGIEEHQWWRLADCEPVDRPIEEWTHEIHDVLDDAVRVRLRADVPFGAFLSGGIDSSSVVALMSQHIPGRVLTFSIGFDDPRFDESRFSTTAAERFGTEHVLEIVDPDMFDRWPMAIEHCDQPHGDVSFLPTHRVAELAATRVKMVLTGDGADELFCGYDKYGRYFGRARGASPRPITRDYLEVLSLFRPAELERMLTPSFLQALGPVDCFEENVRPLLDAVDHMDPINQALYVDTMLLLPGNNLVKPDRMGMAVSIENRSPYLDHRMVELAFTIPGDLKLSNGETKHVLKKTVAPLIGDDLTYRAKQMFTVPVGEWLRTHLFDQARELLLSEQTVARNIFVPSVVESMLIDHRDERANHTRELRALMALEIWFRSFVADED